MKTITRDWLKVLGWWCVVALGIVMLAMLSGCVTSRVSVIKAPLAGYGGITTCDKNNNIIVVINGNIKDENELRYIHIHEMVHVEQALAEVGGCRSMLSRYKADSLFRFLTEARAYCSDYNARVRDGMSPDKITNLVQFLKDAYAKWLTLDEVLDHLPCGGRYGRPAEVLPDGTYHLQPQVPRGERSHPIHRGDWQRCQTAMEGWGSNMG